MAHVEAVIDFGEDENIEEGLLPEGKWALLDLCCWICGIIIIFFYSARESCEAVEGSHCSLKRWSQRRETSQWSTCDNRWSSKCWQK